MRLPPRVGSSLQAVLLIIGLSTTALAEPGRRHATEIKLSPAPGGGASVRVEFDKAPTFTARLENKGRRLLVDVPNADVTGARSALTDRVGIVAGVMAQAFKIGPKKTARILVTLAGTAKYSVGVEGNTLVMHFLPGPTGALVTKPKAAPSVRSVQVEPRVMDVRFEPGKLKDAVIVELSDAAQYHESMSRKGHRLLRLKGAKLPDELKKKLDLSGYEARVTAVESRIDTLGEVLLEAAVESGVDAKVSRQGKALVWSFFRPRDLPSSMTGIGLDGKTARKSRTVSVEEGITGLPEVRTDLSGDVMESVSSAEQAGTFSAAVLAQQRNYRGRRIDLDLKDADVHNVLRLLADVGQVNIVTADNVSGTVTIRMRNVPWDQALDVVLQSKNLGLVRQANMIRVAPLADLEKEREMQIARLQQEVKLAPIETRLVPISYATAGAIQDRAKPLLSERGSLAVDERTNVLIARDIAGNLNQIEELIRSLDTQTPQVLVEARIVEATSRYLRDVGIQWGGDASFSGATGNPTGLWFPNSVGIAGGATDNATPQAGLSPFASTAVNPNFAVNLPAAVGTGQGGAIGLTFGSLDNNFNLALRLSAAEASGMLRILSSPRILTLDNSEARISQGTLIPFSQVSAQGVQTTFQEAKLQLLVRPHVTADGSVSMHVKINRDEPDFNQTSARGDPTILKREAETDLLVMDGNTAVIGGIYTRNTGRNLDQVPFFGDIPLLGLLFQRRRASDTRSELVIFLTPRIVNRAEALGR